MKVLIVDDRALIVADLEDEVKRIRPDAECTGTTSPQDAVHLAEQTRFDVALLDIDMPGMNGISLARRLIEGQPRINVIFVTGFEEYAMESYDLYASAFLVKPVTGKKLKRAFENLRYPVAELDEKTLNAQYAGGNVIGSRIKQQRLCRGMSRRDLAEEMLVTVQTVSRWENGDRMPDIVTFLRLAGVLGVSVEDLTSTRP